MANAYYNVVVSIYNKDGEFIEDWLISSGFKSKDKAMEYIQNNEINEYKYCYADDQPRIEIKEVLE